LSGAVSVPGDKSISHRAAIVAALARGGSRIEGFSAAGDCSMTLSCLEAVGASVRRDGDVVEVEGGNLRAPTHALDCGRSGTTMRLLAGALAGYEIEAVLTGHPQLLARPMGRVAAPLRRMGADVWLEPSGRAPLRVRGRSLRGIEHRSEPPSAQVKSAILLAGLRADGATAVVEPVRTRDHTERLLGWLGAPVEAAVDGGAGRVTIAPARVRPFELRVPGDVSAAASILAAAAAVPGSDVTVTDVGLNPTRMALLDVLRRMGATVDIDPRAVAGPEPRGGQPLQLAVVEQPSHRTVDRGG
jgi:3-phosphoshikimate 1-carboxyvinyltransferase